MLGGHNLMDKFIGRQKADWEIHVDQHLKLMFIYLCVNTCRSNLDFQML